ncbi:MAG: ATP synthase F0 subunit B [Phycisphaeraceae bacterium]|nr:MAG: ATP synthase F0 subunit B [Phycisphaeraceae bacterium]
MKTTLERLILGSGLISLTSAVALAAPAGDDAAQQSGVTYFNIVTYASTVLVFVAAYFILAKTAWPKITGALDARDDKIRSEIKAAEEARQRADDALKEYQKSLAEARAEAARLIEETKAEQSRLAADLRVKAEAEVTQMREAALRGLEAAKNAAIVEIYSEAAMLSSQIAAKILQREVNADDQRRIVEESVAEYSRSYANA